MFGCVHNPEECDCSCHTDGGMHVTPCCSPCQYCERRINISSIESHEKNCKLNPVNIQRIKDELNERLAKLDEAKKVSPEILKKQITI